MDAGSQLNNCLVASETLYKRSLESTFLAALTEKLANKIQRGLTLLKELQKFQHSASKRIGSTLNNYLSVVEDGARLVQSMDEAFKFDQFFNSDRYKTSLYGLLNSIEQAIYELDSELQTAKTTSSKKNSEPVAPVIKQNEFNSDIKSVSAIFQYLDDYLESFTQNGSEVVEFDMLRSLVTHFYVPRNQLKSDISGSRWVPYITISRHWRVGPTISPVEEKVYQADHPDSIRCFLLECRTINQLQVSPYFVRFFGVTQAQTPSNHPANPANPVALLTETTENGTLLDYLKSTPAPLSSQLIMIEDILSGMVFLHSKNLLHCSLNPNSILLTLSGRAKITGLEWVTPIEACSPETSVLNRLLPTRMSDISLPESVLSTIQWFDNDLVLNASFSHSIATEVYSIGLIIWSILSHQLPYDNLSLPELLSKFRRGILPDLKSVPDTFHNLLRSCWHPDPTARPDVPTLKKDFANLL